MQNLIKINFLLKKVRNKRMIGLLEDLNGLKMLKRMQKRKRKCWIIRYDGFGKCRIKGPGAEEFLDKQYK